MQDGPLGNGVRRDPRYLSGENQFAFLSQVIQTHESIHTQVE